MELGDLFWGFFILMFIYPYFVAWWVDRRRNLLLRVIGRKDRAQVITIIQQPSKLALLGIPIAKMIDLGDMEELLDAIRRTHKNKPIDLIMHTTGGMVLTTTQIARALNNHKARTRVIIPYYAMSGGTLIALAADEVVMDQNAILGPVDPQILSFKGALPVNTIQKVVKRKGNKAQDDTMMLASIGKQATKQVEDVVIELTKDKMGLKKAKKLAAFLAKGDRTHDYTITPQEAKEIGINVKLGIRPEIFSLMDTYRLFKQPGIDVLYP